MMAPAALQGLRPARPRQLIPKEDPCLLYFLRRLLCLP
jgi:hypothetical protein